MANQLSKIKIIIVLLIISTLYELVDYGNEMNRVFNLIQERNPEHYSSFIDFYLSLNWESYIFASLMPLKVAACLVFIFSKYSHSKLLRAILLFNLLISCIYLPFSIHQSLQTLSSIPTSNLFTLLIGIVFFGFNIYVLIYLQNSLVPLIKTDEDGQPIFVVTSKTQRFFHRLFDYFFSILLLYLLLQNYQSYFFNNGSLRFREPWDYIFFLESRFFFHMAFSSFFYYCFSEVIFKTSIGKIILGNLIITYSGESPSITQRVGRCFCRLIPLEAFSFLLSTRGWHDRITETYIVKADRLSTLTKENEA